VQVKYVLSDKTGTLTQNIMGFVWASVGGTLYGKSPGMAPADIPANTPHTWVSSEPRQVFGAAPPPPARARAPQPPGPPPGPLPLARARPAAAEPCRAPAQRLRACLLRPAPQPGAGL
jgi:hypothetical protein